MINLQEVSKIYHLDSLEVPALRNINLEINKGDFIAIMGASGSGKSTLMHLLGFLDIPTSGLISLEDKQLENLTESELAEIRGKKLGFIFQSFNLISSLTAIENVILPMTFQNIPRKEKLEKAKSALALVNLEDRLYHLPSQLSGGQKQRVAIARALVNDPEIILADEPTGNLDSKSGQEIINLLIELNKKGRTIILVTHNPLLAKKAKKIIYIQDGELKK